MLLLLLGLLLLLLQSCAKLTASDGGFDKVQLPVVDGGPAGRQTCVLWSRIQTITNRQNVDVIPVGRSVGPPSRSAYRRRRA